MRKNNTAGLKISITFMINKSSVNFAHYITKRYSSKKKPKNYLCHSKSDL